MATFNKGDVAEGILAAAMTARFISKTEDVTDKDVINLIFKLKKPVTGVKGLTSTTSFKSPNAQPKVVDEVICFVNLADVNMTGFLDRSTYNNKEIIDIVRAAAEYANGRYVKEWADMMYENNQQNKIEVLSEGLLDQTGTKVDLKLKIDGKQAGVGVSLKQGDVKQFGQVGGSKFESMKDLWGSLGVSFDESFKTKYIKDLADKKLAPALTSAYKTAYDQLKQKDQKTIKRALSDFMVYHATRNEEDVVLVQLNRGQSSVYEFKKISETLKAATVSVEISSSTTSALPSTLGYKGGSSIPSLIFKVNNKELLKIRLKLEGNRVNSKGKFVGLTVRNYIEKGIAAKGIITN